MMQLSMFPDTVRLQRIDPEQNMYRFYQIRLAPDLFGGCALIREWGRIGTSGSAKEDHFPCAGTATDALLDLRKCKVKRGYIER